MSHQNCLLPAHGMLPLGCMITCLVLAFVAVGCDPASKPLLQPDVVEREIGSTWPVIFFPSVHRKNLNVGIENLDDKELEDGEYEVRIYEGFGLQGFQPGGHPLNLIVIRLHKDTVTTVHHPSHPDGRTERMHEGSGLWNELSQMGLFTLPDSCTIEGYSRGFRDGVSYVVELKRGDRYSHYRYGNPQHADVPEATEFMAILELLREHTGF